MSTSACVHRLSGGLLCHDNPIRQKLYAFILRRIPPRHCQCVSLGEYSGWCQWRCCLLTPQLASCLSCLVRQACYSCLPWQVCSSWLNQSVSAKCLTALLETVSGPESRIGQALKALPSHAADPSYSFTFCDLSNGSSYCSNEGKVSMLYNPLSGPCGWLAVLERPNLGRLLARPWCPVLATCGYQRGLSGLGTCKLPAMFLRLSA